MYKRQHNRIAEHNRAAEHNGVTEYRDQQLELFEGHGGTKQEPLEGMTTQPGEALQLLFGLNTFGDNRSVHYLAQGDDGLCDSAAA